MEPGPPCVALREYIEALLSAKELRDEQRFQAQSAAITAAMGAAEKAVTKAEAAAERRFESVNEFRATLSDQAATFVTRTELEVLREQWRETAATFAARLDTAEGHAGGLTSGWGYLIGAVTLVGAVIAVVLAVNS